MNLWNSLHIGFYNKMTLLFTGIKNHLCSSILSSENNNSNTWVINSFSFIPKMSPIPLMLQNVDLLLLAKIFTVDKIHINLTSTTKLITLQLLLSCPIMGKFFILLLSCSKIYQMKSLFTTLKKKPNSHNQLCSKKVGKEKFNQSSS